MPRNGKPKSQSPETEDFSLRDRGPILDFTEAAQLVGKHRSTIWRWANDGLMPIVRHPSGGWGVYERDFSELYATAIRLHKRDLEAKKEETFVASVASVASVAETV